MKKKLFILIYTLSIVLAVVLLQVIVTIIRNDPIKEPDAIEQADLSLSQFAERPNGRLSDMTMSKLTFLLDYLFPRNQSLKDGCSLQFSFSPEQGAIEPRGEIRYTILVSNRGKERCENASLSLYYTPQELFASSTPEPTASDYYWALGDLPSTETYRIDLTTKTTLGNGGQLISEGCATADNGYDVCSQNVIFVRTGASKHLTLEERLRVPSISRSLWRWAGNDREFGIWVWTSPLEMSPAYAEQVIAISKKNGFNVIYLTIDDYLYYDELPRGEREEWKQKYMRTLSIFIEAANRTGMEVDVVGGGKDWAIPGNRRKGYALIDFVKEYNANYPKQTIRGLQYDVEPYLLNEYNSDRKKVLMEFIEFIDESAQKMKDVPIKFSIVIPHFYDSKQNWTPAYRYKGEEGHTYTHLLRVLAQKKDTSVIVMAYRNFFGENNGTKAISETEIKEATEGGYSTQIIISQETGNVAPAYVTFYDYPKVSLFDALSEIQNYFDQYRNFGGTAVHYFDSFLKLD